MSISETLDLARLESGDRRIIGRYRCSDRCLLDLKSKETDFLGFSIEQWQAADFFISRVHPEDRPRLPSGGQIQHESYAESLRLKGEAGRYHAVDCYLFRAHADDKNLLGVELIAHGKHHFSPGDARDVLERVNFTVYWVDANGVVFDCNQAAYRNLGMQREELIGLPVSSFDLFVARGSFKQIMHSQLQDDNLFHFETLHKRKDGSTYALEIHGQKLFSSNGKDVYVGIGQSLEDRNRTLLALEQEHHRANYYLDIAGVIIVTLDDNGCVTMLNRFACELFGIEQDAAIGLNWFDSFLPPESRQPASDAYQRLLASDKQPKQEIERPIITQRGEYRLIRWNNRMLEDENGERIGILSSGSDITAQRASEQTLLAEKSRLRTLIDSIPDLVFFKDSDSRYLGCNKAYEIMSGKAESDLVGKDDFFLFGNTGSATRMRDGDKEVLASQKPLRVNEWVTYADGRKVLLDTFKTPVYDGDQRMVGVLGVSRDITENTMLSGQLSLVNAMVDISLDPLICTVPDRDFKIVYANSAAIKHFDVPAAQLYQTKLVDWDAKCSLEDIQRRWQEIQHTQRIARTTHRLRSGEEIPVEVSSRPFVYEDTTYMITVFKDIRDRISYEEAVKTAEQRSRLLLEHTNEGIFGVDASGVMTFINPAAAKMLGYRAYELIGRKASPLIHAKREDGSAIDESDCSIMKSITDGRSYRIEHDVFWCRDGHSIPVEYWSSPIQDDDGISGAVVTFHDITHRRKAEEQIRYLAFHDALTGLPNRRLFLDRFEHELSLDRRSGQHSALHLLDIDHFKEVNDSLGHPAGDQLLIEVAKRIQESLRDGDTFARLGGDEFAILQSSVTTPSDIAVMAEKVIQCFEQPFDFLGNKLKTNTSIGIVLCDEHVSADDLIAWADIALYQAKERGRGCYIFYQSEMTERVQREAELAHMLSSARFLQQLHMEYQPQFCCQSGKLIGFEALLRWQHPEIGAISPLTFIPVAEKRGMIDDIGFWVAQHVATQIASWDESGYQFGAVSFNLSPVQLRNQEGVQALLELLTDSELALDTFEVEITESACMDAGSEVLDMLESAASSGLRLAIDDFGTGYSSMVALKQLSASRLKIDRSFVRDMLDDPNDRQIVSATIALGHSLGLEVVAEGVETAQQLEVLRELGCDVVQGYFLGMPLGSELVSTFLAQGQLIYTAFPKRANA